MNGTARKINGAEQSNAVRQKRKERKKEEERRVMLKPDTKPAGAAGELKMMLTGAVRVTPLPHVLRVTLATRCQFVEMWSVM